MKIIDKVTVSLNERRDVYEALLLNLGVKGVEVSNTTVKQYENSWSAVSGPLLRCNTSTKKARRAPLPAQRSETRPDAQHGPGRAVSRTPAFTEAQWIDVLLRSTGLEPTHFDERVKWHLLCRMVPLVENNYNVCELGPRGTGKSHIYKEISPNSILISGGHTTVANLFITWRVAPLAWSACGMWWPLTKSPGLPFRTEMACRS